MGDEEDGSDSVHCHTDLSTCCSGAQGPHHYFAIGISPMEQDCHSLDRVVSVNILWSERSTSQWWCHNVWHFLLQYSNY